MKLLCSFSPHRRRKGQAQAGKNVMKNSLREDLYYWRSAEGCRRVVNAYIGRRVLDARRILSFHVFNVSVGSIGRSIEGYSSFNSCRNRPLRTDSDLVSTAGCYVACAPAN